MITTLSPPSEVMQVHPSPSPPEEMGGDSLVGVIAGSVAGAVLLLAILLLSASVACCMYVRRKRSRKAELKE